MTDIVERLRNAVKPTRILDLEDLTNAADEIESLRQQLAECEQQRDSNYDEMQRAWAELKESIRERNAFQDQCISLKMKMTVMREERDAIHKKWATQCDHVDFLESQRKANSENTAKYCATVTKERDECLQTIARLDEANLCMHTEIATVTAERDELVRAIERMRVAGGSHEFHMAFELAKDALAKLGDDKTGDGS